MDVTKAVAVIGSGWAGGALGWWSWAHYAYGRSSRISRRAWATAVATAVGAMVAATSYVPGTRLLDAAALATWAGITAVLALVDASSLVVPTSLTRAGLVTTASLAAAASWVSEDWRSLPGPFLTCMVAAGVYGMVSLSLPGALGLGDARMASLVGLGASMRTVPGTLVALSFAPLAAGLVGLSIQRGGSSGPGGKAARAAVPLGPFLAIAGLLAAVASAI